MESESGQEIEDERLKLQHDIQRIQDTLFDDSYSEYDSDDSECFEIILDSKKTSPLGDEDTWTRSSFGESSTSHYGGTEISEESACIQEITKPEETELPVTAESSLALNRAYQEVITDILKQIEEALETTRRKQDDCEKDLISEREQNVHPGSTRMYSRQYSIPYIKDPNGGVPPHNEDVVIKKAFKEHKQDCLPEKNWIARDQKRLFDAVAEDALQQLIHPLMIKIELEQGKLEKCSPKEEKGIQKRIAVLEEAVAEKKNTARVDLLLNVDTSKTDWLKISNIAYHGRKSFTECQMMWENVLSLNVNKKEWYEEEEQQHLTELVQEENGLNWEKIASQLNTGRTPFQCLQFYQTKLNPDNQDRPWTKYEDNRLIEVVNSIRTSGHRLIWNKVASYMDSRGSNQCFQRFNQVDPSLRRGNWSYEEDKDLCKAVKLCGTQSWMKIAEFVPGRSSVQCRDRWLNSLNPNLRMGAWTYEEDKKLLKVVEEIGLKNWTKVAGELKGRTDNMVLQRYRRLLKWKERTRSFQDLPEEIRQTLLGHHLLPEELKRMENLTWMNFQSELGVSREDYQKQQHDQYSGDVVVPRPPPLFSYGKTLPHEQLQAKIQLQKMITRHVQQVKDGNIDADISKELAVHLQKAYAYQIPVKKLLELSEELGKGRTLTNLLDASRKRVRKETANKTPRAKHCFNYDAVKMNTALEMQLRQAVQTIYKFKRKMKKGRPRRFFTKTADDDLDEEKLHEVGIKSLHLVMKALDIDTRKMLKSASHIKEKCVSAPAENSSTSPAVNETVTSNSTPSTEEQSRSDPNAEEPENDVTMLASVSETSQDEDMVEFVADPEDAEVPTTSTQKAVSLQPEHNKKASAKLSESGKRTASSFRGYISKKEALKAAAQVSKETLQGDGMCGQLNVSEAKNSCAQGTVKDGATSPSSSLQMSTSSASLSNGACRTHNSTGKSRAQPQIDISDDDTEEATTRTKVLPLLPPNITNLKAFRTLLLKRRSHISNSRLLLRHSSKLDPKKQKQEIVDAADFVRKKGRPASSSQVPQRVVNNVEADEESRSLTWLHMKNILNSQEYALLRARFQALFMWPALISTIHPPFDRKEFRDKAATIKAGETEVLEVPKITKPKGYPMSHGKRYYRKNKAKSSEQSASKRAADSSNALDEVKPVMRKRRRVASPSEPVRRSSRDRKEIVFTEKRKYVKKDETIKTDCRQRVSRRALLANKFHQSMIKMESVASEEAEKPQQAAKTDNKQLLFDIPVLHDNDTRTPNAPVLLKTEAALTAQAPSEVVLPVSVVNAPVVSAPSDAVVEQPVVSESVAGVNSSLSTTSALRLNEGVIPQLNLNIVSDENRISGGLESIQVNGQAEANTVPMLLTYVRGEDGNMVPVLKTLPPDFIPSTNADR